MHPADAAAALWITVHGIGVRTAAWIAAPLRSRLHERAGVLDKWSGERERATVRQRRGAEQITPNRDHGRGEAAPPGRRTRN